MNFENGINGMIPQAEWLNVGGQDMVTRPNDPIDRLFGDEKTDNIAARWQFIADEYRIPLMAQFHGFDTEAQKTVRYPIENKYIEKGLIKVKIDQSERLREYMKSGVVQTERLAKMVFDDGLRLADQVFTRSKVAKYELMASGKVTIKENNLDLTVDYGVPEAQTSYTIDLSPESDIIGAIQQLIDDASAKGVTITGMMTSKRNITRMKTNRGLQQAIYGTLGMGTTISTERLYDFLASEFGIMEVVENDKVYNASATLDVSTGRPVTTTARFFPTNKISFFATNEMGRVGTGLWGDPPEVSDGLIDVSTIPEVSNFVYIMQWTEKDPAVLWTKASALFIPVLYNPNSLWIATVTDNNIDTPYAEALDSTDTLYGYTVSDLGENILVGDKAISGTLKYVNSGSLATEWGAGNFLPITFNAADWAKYTSVKVGLEPSAGAGLQELIGHLDDLDSAFKITDKNMQKLVIVATDGKSTNKKSYDLSGLTTATSLMQ